MLALIYYMNPNLDVFMSSCSDLNHVCQLFYRCTLDCKFEDSYSTDFRDLDIHMTICFDTCSSPNRLLVVGKHHTHAELQTDIQSIQCAVSLLICHL